MRPESRRGCRRARRRRCSKVQAAGRNGGSLAAEPSAHTPVLAGILPPALKPCCVQLRPSHSADLTSVSHSALAVTFACSTTG